MAFTVEDLLEILKANLIGTKDITVQVERDLIREAIVGNLFNRLSPGKNITITIKAKIDD